MNTLNWLNQTMLIERLVGVGVYAFFLMMTYFFLKSAKDYKSVCRTLNVYLILLCLLAFFYVPSTAADLYRWRFLSRNWPQMSFAEFYEVHLKSNTVPVAYLLIYLANLTGISGVLPAFCAFVFFLNVFHILKDLYKKHNISAPTLATALLLIMASGCFLEVISGVRCFMALSILSRCFYDEIINNKPIVKNLLWELIASLIHPMALVIFVIRLCFLLMQKSNSPIKKIMNIGVMLIAAFFAYQYGRGYIQAALNKAETYASSETAYSYIWEHIIGAILVVAFISILLYSRKDEKPIGFKSFILINILFVAIELIFVFEYNTFHRTITLSLITMIPVLAHTINDGRNKGLRNFITVLSLLVLVVAAVRGNLCGYKFFLLN